MSVSDQKRYLNLSFAFYNKDKSAKSDIVDKSRSVKSSLQNYSTLIGTKKVDLLTSFIEKPYEQQRNALKDNSLEIIGALTEGIEKCENLSLREIFLTTLDGILIDDRRNIKVLLRIVQDQSGSKNVIAALQSCLYSKDSLIAREAATRILSFVVSELDRKDPQVVQKQTDLVRKIIGFRTQKNAPQQEVGDYVILVSLANILRHQHLVQVFLDNNGVEVLKSLLESQASDFQTSYYALLNLWLISFSEQSFPYFQNPVLGLIKLVTDVIQKFSREKLIRVAFMLYRNLCENCTDSIEFMVDSNLIKIVDIQLKGNIKDQDLLDDLKFVGENLEKNYRILTSFEKYVKEIQTERLTWSPVHSEKFWKENVKRFEEKEYQLIKKLAELLNSKNLETVAVACYDLGEFCRFHPYGRTILESVGAKNRIMDCAKHEDFQIRENSLLALQKIMLHNWQIGGK